MGTSLFPCPACQRHIRITEASCPFCKGALSESWASGAERRATVVRPGVRLSRAALFAAGALAIAPTACGGEADDAKPGTGGGNSGGQAATGGSGETGGDNVGPVYGLPADGGANNNGTGGNNVAVYGGPPDGGAGGMGGNSEMGGASTGGDNSVPVYGIAPVGGRDASGTGGDGIGPVYGLPPG